MDAQYIGRFTKLNDGSWGVRIGGLDSKLRPGTTTSVLVRKRSGEEKTHRVVVLWSGPDRYNPGQSALCRIEAAEGRSGERVTTSFTCADCGASYPGAGSIRRDSSGLEGEVCRTCNRLSDYELSFG